MLWNRPGFFFLCVCVYSVQISGLVRRGLILSRSEMVFGLCALPVRVCMCACVGG